MNLKTLAFTFTVAIAPAFAAEGWLNNIDKGIEQAKKDNKLVLVEFTGSDWCPPCKALKKDVFPSPEFQKIADKSLVLVELDFPRQKEISEEQKKYNGEMAKKYAITGYPTVYLLNNEGAPVWVRVGGGAKDEYLQELQDGIKNATTITEGLAAAKAASGIEKAKLLDKVYKAMSDDLKTSNAAMAEEIIALDKEDTLGYGKAKKAEDAERAEETASMEFFQKTISPLLTQEKYDDAIAKIKEYAAKPELSKATKQQLHMQGISAILMQKGDIDAAIEAMKEGVAIDPESELGKQAPKIIKHIQDNKDKIKAQIEEQKKAMKEAIKAAAEKKAAK